MTHSRSVIDAIHSAIGADLGEGVVGYSEAELSPPEGGPAGIRIYLADDSVQVPDTIGGQPVHTVVVGRFVDKAEPQVGADPEIKQRPVFGGVSISCMDNGTLGYFVRDRTGKLCLLTAAHVLGGQDRNVIQPGRSHGGKPGDKVAELIASVDSPGDGVDAACARLVEGIEATLALNSLGKVTGTAVAVLGAAMKSGSKAPNVTTGDIIDVAATCTVSGVSYSHMILVQARRPDPFSKGGDSGSLVVQGANAVGLLKGGSDCYDVVCHIDMVLYMLSVTLAV